jgi:hypothetical protein
MLRNLTVSVLALLVSAGGCARHTIPPVNLQPQTRLGPAQDFGPGITNVTPSDVDLQLDASGYVVALRVTRAYGIQVIAPVSGSPTSKRGSHYYRGGAPLKAGTDTTLRAASSKACTVRADSREACTDVTMPYRIAQLKQGGAPDDAVGYWLLIVSDVPTAGREVMRRLGEIDLADGSLEALVRSIPEPLIASRTAHWAAYYTAFGTPMDHP